MAVLLFHLSRAPFYCLNIEKSSWNHFFRLTAGLVCQKSPFVKKTAWTAIFRAAALFTRYLDQNHAWFLSKATNSTLKFIKHKHENTGAGHIFKSACWHLNRRISTGPCCRMKTTKWSYIIVPSRSFIFRSHILFLRSYQLQMCTSTSITSWWRHFIKRQVEVKDGLQKYFWDRKIVLTVAKYDKLSLRCLHTTRSMWATRALELILSWTFAKFESPLYLERHVHLGNEMHCGLLLLLQVHANGFG